MEKPCLSPTSCEAHTPTKYGKYHNWNVLWKYGCPGSFRYDRAKKRRLSHSSVGASIKSQGSNEIFEHFLLILFDQDDEAAPCEGCRSPDSNVISYHLLLHSFVVFRLFLWGVIGAVTIGLLDFVYHNSARPLNNFTAATNHSLPHYWS